MIFKSYLIRVMRQKSQLTLWIGLHWLIIPHDIEVLGGVGNE